LTSDVRNIIEALIFASEEEITAKQIKEVLDSFSFKLSIKEIDEAVDELNTELKSAGKPLEVIKIAGGYQFATRKEYALYVGKLFTEKQKKKLSQSSIETLAIIAYKQPITRSEIEFIRGVNVDYIVNSLLERDLISIVGRADSPGRPILYGTTKNFLKVLGLNAVEDLPKLREINEILKNEKIEGITEADIDLFNSINKPGGAEEEETDEISLDFEQPAENSLSEEEDGDEETEGEAEETEDEEVNAGEERDEELEDETGEEQEINDEEIHEDNIEGNTEEKKYEEGI
jgi:segregation and condensation protein B